MKDCFGHELPRSAYIIRATEVSEFLNCPLRWGIMSHNGLNLEPVVTKPSLRFGTIWHKVLEWYYSPNAPEDRVSYALKGLEIALAKDREELEQVYGDVLYAPEMVTMLEEEEALLRAMFQGYLQWTDNPDVCPYPESDYRMLSTEKRYLVPILTPTGARSKAYLAVKLDGIAEKGDFLWVWEHKTRGKSSSVSNPEHLDLDLQMGLQLLALHKMLQANPSHIAVRGAVYNLARKQKPGPRVKSALFGRHEVIRSAEALERLERFLYSAYREMHKYSLLIKGEGVLPWRYNPQAYSGICTWGCAAKHVCSAKANGGDVEYLLSVDFKPRERDIWQTLEEEMSDQE